MVKVTIEVVKEITMAYELTIDETKYDNLEEIVDEINRNESRWKLQDYEDAGLLSEPEEYDDQIVILKRVTLSGEDNGEECPICDEFGCSCYCDGSEPDDRYDVIISN